MAEQESLVIRNADVLAQIIPSLEVVFRAGLSAGRVNVTALSVLLSLIAFCSERTVQSLPQSLLDNVLRNN